MTANRKKLLDLLKPGEEKLRADLESQCPEFALPFGWLIKAGYFVIKHDKTGKVIWPQVIRRRTIEEHHQFLIHNGIK